MKLLTKLALLILSVKLQVLKNSVMLNKMTLDGIENKLEADNADKSSQ